MTSTTTAVAVDSNAPSTSERGGEAPTRARKVPSVVRYEVKTGDSIYGIARAHGTTSERLVHANELGVRRSIEIGQVLRVPVDIDKASYAVKAKFHATNAASLGTTPASSRSLLAPLSKRNLRHSTEIATAPALAAGIGAVITTFTFLSVRKRVAKRVVSLKSSPAMAPAVEAAKMTEQTTSPTAQETTNTATAQETTNTATTQETTNTATTQETTNTATTQETNEAVPVMTVATSTDMETNEESTEITSLPDNKRATQANAVQRTTEIASSAITEESTTSQAGVQQTTSVKDDVDTALLDSSQKEPALAKKSRKGLARKRLSKMLTTASDALIQKESNPDGSSEERIYPREISAQIGKVWFDVENGYKSALEIVSEKMSYDDDSVQSRRRK
ncbi:hypothetical protein BE221DRAFT_189472 [Ostreococcus tauri]|uniref:LysM domain-containing protein n=1 Tax=Ostreococcus tauri TaxID=70448 RepID=A0A1Y5IGN9_OSTTA|nr:hypothetical protein BE221DRAFT_189472 [Ostreococcus tauri]